VSILAVLLQNYYVCQTSGVVQGSVLGSLCFVLYINDLPQFIKHCKIKMYADDVKLYFVFPSGANTYIMQLDLDNIAMWAATWQLTISI
jgi:hypothetical protein